MSYVEKALQRVNELIEKCEEGSEEHTDYVVMKQALEKQMPKKIYHHSWNGIDGVPYDLCPHCKTNLCTNGFMPSKKENYCANCGQKLDWSNKDDLLFNSAAGGGKTKTMLSEAMGLQGKFDLRKDLGGTNENND